ncbi:MAG: hypothetical protein ACLTDR_09775 [Adlercreutzia equolifaciens]
MDGCHSCPIHCYSDLRVPASAEPTAATRPRANTCAPNFPVSVLHDRILGDNTS